MNPYLPRQWRNIVLLVLSSLLTLCRCFVENEDDDYINRSRLRGGPLSLKAGETIEFEAEELKREGIYNPNYWTENNERSTSKGYTLWEQADVHFVEWPGNITVRNSEWPLLKWGKSRAKYLVNRCCESFVGIEMRAYAYRYLFLTWGHYRFRRTVSPLTIPAELIRNYSEKNAHLYGSRRSWDNATTELPVSDFVFGHDSLVLSIPNVGIVVRVHGLELAYSSHELEASLYPLKYWIANGISTPVNKLVSQYCCAKTENGQYCPHGETIVAYQEYSSDFRIFISADGGENFKTLFPAIPTKSVFLHSVLSYPESDKVLILHGTQKVASLDSYSMSTGALISGGKSAPVGTQLNGITGMLQASRIGEEMSFIIWDKCNVWYSLGKGRNVTKALFYVHGFIRTGRPSKKHYIMPRYCRFGENSSLAVSNWGKLALLDADNNFHLGVDSKTSTFQLVPLQVDMSLVLPKHSMSIVPNFDHNHHPKLVYPPRYLELPKRIFPKGKNYSQRLGIRLLPKTVFPSEFITIFYDENARLPKKFKNFGLGVCQTSSISVNRSISQKAKYYTFKPFQYVNFTVRFKSRINASRQLHYEPMDVTKFLNVRIRQISIGGTEPGDDQYWMTYEVVIKSVTSTGSRRIFRLTFYTSKTLRCNIQPSVPVYVKIDDDPAQDMNNDDMTRRSFLRTDEEHIEYGKAYKAQDAGGRPSCSDESKSKCSAGSKCHKRERRKLKMKSINPEHIREAVMQHSEL